MLNLPPRSPDTVPVTAVQGMSVAYRPWQLSPPQDALVIIVKVGFAIGADGALEQMSDAPLPIGDLHYGDDLAASLQHASDFAPFKPKADILLVGHAHANPQNPGVTNVQLAFGGMRKAVAAIGPRTWEGNAPGAPAAFERIPLCWEQAFGGAGYEPNPVGVGLGGELVPALEDPNALMRQRSDRPTPACFAPIAPTWARRRHGLGTYDAAWRRDRWPYYPEDFDWSHFNAAPEDQRVDFPHGDERFDLAGVHPEIPVISGKLPGLAPRAFALVRRDGDQQDWIESTLRLDTVCFDADEMTVTLTWRGLLEVSAENAPEVDWIYVAADHVDAPAKATEHRQQFAGAMVATYGAEVLPDAERAELADVAELKPEALPPPTQTPTLTRTQVEALLASGTSLVGLAFVACDLKGLDLRGRDLTGAFFTDADLEGANLEGAILSGAVLARVAGAGLRLRGANLDSANLSAAKLDDADLSAASMRYATLADVSADRARFEGADLFAAKLCDASLRGACFDEARAQHADLSGATLDEATFRKANLDDARLYGTRGRAVCFDDASLAVLRADEAQLAEASMMRTNAAGAVLQSAVLTGARFDEADLSSALLSHADLEGAVMRQVLARKARFRGAKLHGVSALRADFMEANFESADLTNGDLRGASLHAAETWKADLTGAQLEGALLTATKLAP